ncbi:DUF28-domain-containing protein [Nadsonia fulvescens var. elongata DSM 6958]|uniref:DUF28-domain-containing protein n=1 Tax=Nadsonia fulvescens var. elongata DSM 6958 TaxID=857566 RepID=A0A1E3PG61_9ASCO|nr:DUF28-domain-containing protein [Nadsonia fulvescens var. elongata DSM 6958]
MTAARSFAFRLYNHTKLNFGSDLHVARSFSSTPIVFSGHNKWSTIKHDKAKNDAQKSKMATKFGGQIAVAVKAAGSDPANNIRLANLLELASKANVGKKVIEAAIKRGSGITDGKEDMAEVALYEAMGPGGVAFIIEAFTNNKNRTVGHVKSIINKCGGSMSPTLYMFDRRGYVRVSRDAESTNYDDAFEHGAEAGAEDIEEVPLEDLEPGEAMGPDGQCLYVVDLYTEPQTTGKVSENMKALGYSIKDVGFEYIPKEDMLVDIVDEENMERLDKIMTNLDDLDDVTDIYSNVKSFQ